MADEQVDDEEPQLADAELDDEDLDEDLDEDVIEDDLDTLDLGDEVVVDALVEPAEDTPKVATSKPKGDDEDEDGLDLDEESHPDDVEVPLDALLKERTASAKLEDEEEDLEDDEPDADDRGEGPTKIMPRRPGEFLCTSCFLVLPRNQLGDEARMLCRDCV